jgi:hypothetical protein
LWLKKKAFLFFLFLMVAIVVTAFAVYVIFFLPSGLSSTETATRLNSIYSRTQVILSNMSDNIQDYSQGIDNSTYLTRMINLKNDMTALRTELTEIRKVAFPTYTRSIDLLDLGLQWYIDGLDYAQRFNFNSASQCLQWGTEDIIQSTYVLPKA